MSKALSQQDERWAERLASKLLASRLAGRVTPEQPMTGAKLAAWFSKELGRKITDATIRSWVHHLRTTKGELIASSSSEPAGYFYARKESELQKTFEHMSSRRRELQEAEDRMRQNIRELKKRDTATEDMFPDLVGSKKLATPDTLARVLEANEVDIEKEPT